MVCDMDVRVSQKTTGFSNFCSHSPMLVEVFQCSYSFQHVAVFCFSIIALVIHIQCAYY